LCRNAQSGTKTVSKLATHRGPNIVKVIYLVATGGTIEKVYSEQTGMVLNVSSKIDYSLRLSACLTPKSTSCRL
jgi:hypothetical protein